VGLGLAYASATTDTHSKATTDAEDPPRFLKNIEAGARERLAGSSVCGGLPVGKAWCFAYQVSLL
jgi:hypothetical protein